MVNENLEQQAAAYFYHQFIVNADPSWKEGLQAGVLRGAQSVCVRVQGYLGDSQEDISGYRRDERRGKIRKVNKCMIRILLILEKGL